MFCSVCVYVLICVINIMYHLIAVKFRYLNLAASRSSDTQGAFLFPCLSSSCLSLH